MWIRIKETINISNGIIGYLKLRKRFEQMSGIEVKGYTNKKLKSIFHYLVNDNEQEAYKHYKKLINYLKDDLS